jgi:hypothetical protein
MWLFHYINDIGEKLLSLSRLFADDTSLGYSSQNVVEIENVINHDLSTIIPYFIGIFKNWEDIY